MKTQLLIIGVSILWVLMCGRMWLMIDRANIWQRRAVAIGAGLGAALIYIIGTALWTSVEPSRGPTSGEEIRISAPRK